MCKWTYRLTALKQRWLSLNFGYSAEATKYRIKWDEFGIRRSSWMPMRAMSPRLIIDTTTKPQEDKLAVVFRTFFFTSDAFIYIMLYACALYVWSISTGCRLLVAGWTKQLWAPKASDKLTQKGKSTKGRQFSMQLIPTKINYITRAVFADLEKGGSIWVFTNPECT